MTGMPARSIPCRALTMALAAACVLFAAGCAGIGGPEEGLFVARDFTAPDSFTSGVEGPAVDAAGNLYAVNFARQGTIGRVTPEGQAEVFVALPAGSIGNGIRFGGDGAMYIADYTGHNILRVDMQTRAVGVHAHEPKMNQPNDIAIDDGGTLFASDPNWRATTGQIWRIDRDGRTTLLEANMNTTNGIEVDRARRRLYVGESRANKIWAYDLSPRGDVARKRLLIDFHDEFGLDGMRCDGRGNLYVTRHGKGSVMIVSPAGRVVREVALLGKKPTNIAFGGPDGRTCYVTEAERRNIETFRTDTPGQAWRR